MTHQLRVGGTAHLGGRAGLAVTHEREQLVAKAGALIVDVGPAELPTWMYRAPRLAWFTV